MGDISLIKIKENYYGFKGSVEYWKTVNKSIVVDGETYHKRDRINVKTSVCKLKKEYPYDVYDTEYAFKELDYCFKLQNISKENLLYTYYRENADCNYHYSNNDYVSNIMRIYDLGLLDKRIKEMVCGKNDTYRYAYIHQKTDWIDILNGENIWIKLYGYGWSNSIIYSVDIQTILEMDYNKIPFQVIKLFKYGGINLKHKKVMTKALMFFNKKISQKNRNKWNY